MFNDNKGITAPDTPIDEDKPDSTLIDSLEKIGNIHEADHYIVDNEFILTGYRINFNTIKSILKRYVAKLNIVCLCFTTKQ